MLFRSSLVLIQCTNSTAETMVVRGAIDLAKQRVEPTEIPPNDWYFNVVLRGAVTCQLPETYCWQLFDYMRGLQSACA